MSKQKKTILIILNAALLLLSAVCIIAAVSKTHALASQREAERWKGESELDYAQVSCFVPDGEKIGTQNINAFRSDMMQAFSEASLDTTNVPFIDAWSCEGSAKVASDKAGSSVPVTAVGGQFFAFHPLRLLAGNYISEDDGDRLRVVLDEELAWFLYGSYDVAGMTLKIGPQTFTVAGVVERNKDFATKKAYSAGMGLFMNYDAYCDVATEAPAEAAEAPSAPGITCYEVCLPDPVKNFAVNLVESKFPAEGGEVLVNSGRYSLSKLLAISKNFASRVLSSGQVYPSWENAARYAENKSATLVLLAIAFALCPLVTLLVLLIRFLKAFFDTLREDRLPKLKDNVEESIRKVRRKQWEKEHNQKEL